MRRRRALPFLAALIVVVATPHAGLAQLRASIGAGAGIAGSTDASLSEGRGGPVAMLSLAVNAASRVAFVAEANGWLQSHGSAAFVTGNARLRLVQPLALELGVGYGTGDPDGGGRINGPALQLGVGYVVTPTAARHPLTLFANGLVAYSSARSMQMVAAGLAIAWR